MEPEAIKASRWRDPAWWIVSMSSLATTVLALLASATARYRAPFSDEIVYRLHAHNLLRFHFYGYTRTEYIAYRPPGYTFFDAAIRAINNSNSAVRTSQAILAGVIVFLAAWIARRLFGGVASAVTALLLMGVGTIAAYASFELSETLATFTLLAAIALLISAMDRPGLGRGIAAGAFLGGSILTRPQTELLIIPLVLVIALPSFRDRDRLKLALALIGGAILIVVPWTIRNAIRLHAFVPVSTYGGEVLYIANNPKADGYFHRTDLLSGQTLYEEIQSKPEEQQDRMWRQLAFQFIEHHPGKAIRNWLRDGWYYLKLPDDLTQKWYRVTAGRRIPPLDDRFLWPLVLLGAIPVIRSKRRGSKIPLVVIAYFIAFFMLFIPSPRFRHGVIPFNAIVAAAGFAFVVQALVNRVRRSRVRAAGQDLPE